MGYFGKRYFWGLVSTRLGLLIKENPVSIQSAVVQFQRIALIFNGVFLIPRKSNVCFFCKFSLWLLIPYHVTSEIGLVKCSVKNHHQNAEKDFVGWKYKIKRVGFTCVQLRQTSCFFCIQCSCLQDLWKLFRILIRV